MGFYKQKELEKKKWEKAELASEEKFKPEGWIPGRKKENDNQKLIAEEN